MRPLRVFVLFFLILIRIHSLFSLAHPTPFEAHFIDVGYGDAILLKLPRGGTMLIDGGTEECGQIVLRLTREDPGKEGSFMHPRPRLSHRLWG